MGLKTSITREQLTAAVPTWEGTVDHEYLGAPVTIFRDAYGIPHVRASSLADAFFAQGFVHATDRLWQMEFDRRRAIGRWSEVVGQSGLLMDRFVRRAGIRKSAEVDVDHFDDETRTVFESYAAGVNAFIETTDKLPIEYEIAGIQPEPWEPWHSTAVFKIRHILMGTAMSKLLRARVLHHCGPEIASTLRSESLGDEVLVVPTGERYRGALKDLAELDPGQDAISRLAEFDAGSNNWAVHGSRSASGRPLVAGDPHRALDVPNVYYQNHLACDDFDVVGYSFCGVPGFPHFGHNEHVAWCITHASADYQDLFVEHFDPNNPTRYEFKREWREAERRVETIVVRDSEPEELEIIETHHGPVVIGDPKSGAALSLRYSALIDPNGTFGCLLPMLRAKTVDEFDAAMRGWVDPCNNLIMADTSGNIAYLTRGKVPIRNRSNFWLPVPGWNGEHEWHGEIPFSEMPRERNPETGYLVTANNRIVGSDYPYRIAIDFAPPSRAQRILSRLEEIDSATVDDMASVHAERLSLPAGIFIDALANVHPSSSSGRRGLDILRSWDRRMEPDSAGAAIYIAIRQHLTTAVANLPTFSDLKHNPFAAQEPPLAGPLTLLWFTIPHYLSNNIKTVLPNGTSWSGLLSEAFEAAIRELEEMQGSEPDAWTWGAMHRTNPQHPLADVESELSHVLNPPSVAVGGDGDTPQAAAINYGRNYDVAGTSVNRYIFDLANWENSRWIVPLGSSGHPGSPHFADQAELWAEVRYIPMHYSWDRIEQEARYRQTLKPSA